MTDGIATLSLELAAVPAQRRSARTAPDAATALREYVLGPENTLVTQGLGLDASGSGTGPSGPGPSATMPLRIEIVPLTLTAPPGLGKSQLLHALMATWTRQHAPDSALLLTAADFTRNYAAAIKLDDVPRFQQRYQRVELLLIDDLDMLRSKPGAQQQLAIIVEHRQRHQRPAVFSARQALRLLGLSHRLTSRLAGGLEIPLQMPSVSTREAILQRLCEQRQLRLTSEATRLLSENESVTVPQLMGLLNQLRQQVQPNDTRWMPATKTTCPPQPRPRRGGPKVAAPAIVDGSAELAEEIDATLVQRLLQTAAAPQVEATDIIRVVARYFGLHPGNLSGSSRRRMDVLSPQLCDVPNSPIDWGELSANWPTFRQS